MIRPRTPRSEPLHPWTRIAAGLAAAAALILLAAMSTLRADPRGLGTHQQLGLPACSWHVQRGYVCPTCGVTTAFTLASQGRLLSSLATQPFGTAMALAAAAIFWLGGWAALTGSGFARWIFRRAMRPSIGGLAAAALVLSWAYRLIVG